MLIDGMSRQEKRKFARTANKKIGQIRAIEDEFKRPIQIGKAKAHFKNLVRLHADLGKMGVIKQPTKWQRIKGRIKSTLNLLFRGKIVN